jgi:hypothetical protein
MPDFVLTPKQQEAQELLNGPARHILLEGGSRSGKTLLTVRKIVQRALKAPGSRHLIARFRLSHVRQSIAHDTFPKVMSLCFPGVPYDLNKGELFVQLPGNSEVWLGGLDDKQRTEKILGTEFVSIFLNEGSQIPWTSRNTVMTRLAQKVKDRATGNDLVTKFYYDCNPPSKAHWLFKLFHAHKDPDTGKPIPDGLDYAHLRLNPKDNQQNLSDEYIKTLESMPARYRKRYLEGEWADATPGALFSEDIFERWRVMDGELPEFLRVVVAVDPSGADDEENTENDEIGIHVAALGVDGVGYLLEDLTCKVGPAKWGRIATDAFDRHGADRVVGEVNFGGAMVGFVIRQARAHTPYRAITASRGKTVRAEPVSALMEEGKVRIVGMMPGLEEELLGFTTHGYVGERSPNRADAAIWAVSDLFPQLLKAQDQKKEPKAPLVKGRRGSGAWMNSL